MPAGADNSASWSLLVGAISMISTGNSSLHRLHRFRVARSGRVLGRSGDALEILGDVDYEFKDASSHISGVLATPSPDGRSLCLFSGETRLSNLDHIVPPRPLQLHLNLGADDSTNDRRITVSPLPGLPPELKPVMPTRPISAAGDLWAPYLTKHYGPARLVMQRLDKDADLWVQVAAIDLPQERKMPGMLAGRPLHGYAVVGRTILLSLLPSLQPSHLFFTFDCSTHTWAAVVTTGTSSGHYIPIRERGMYVEEDDTIYFLSGSFVCAYKLCQDQAGQYWMAPPTTVDRLCPFSEEEGYGFLTHLGGRVMSAVWISVSLRCNCNALHVLITTFQVMGNNESKCEPFTPKGIKVLHSTCRQLDMSPSKPSDSYSEFSFLQEYDEFDHESATPSKKMVKHDAMTPSVLLQKKEIGTTSNVLQSSETQACCREILNGIAYSPAVILHESAIQVNKDVYITCQVASRSTMYKITILDGMLACHNKTLTPCYNMHTRISDGDYDLPWHSFYARKCIYTVPSKQNYLFAFDLHSGNLNSKTTYKPAHLRSIALVVPVGNKIIAIGDTLQHVYHLTYPGLRWDHRKKHVPVELKRRIKLSGYVVLSEYSFMVSDADTSDCFLLDLRTDIWTVVVPDYWRDFGILTGRSVYVEGFIYTRIDGGLAAYEITEDCNSYYLGNRIDLPFSWRIFSGSDRMRFDYVGKDASSGVMFCAVQGGDDDHRCASPSKHPVFITTVQVKTEKTFQGKWRPLVATHVDIGTSFIPQIPRKFGPAVFSYPQLQVLITSVTAEI